MHLGSTLLAAAVTLLSSAARADSISGTGSAVVTELVITSSKQSGDNTLLTLEVTATLTGILEGTSRATETAIRHADGTTNVKAVETFTGTANGVAGTLVFRSVGVIDAAGALDGHFTITDASEGLEGTRGQGSLHSGTYEITLQCVPNP